MAWSNGPITLYHGCDLASAQNICVPSPPFVHGIQLARGAKLTDFGQGFYTTTYLKQAMSWANLRSRALGASGSVHPPAVLSFQVNRDWLATLDAACFVTEGTNPDFWDLVSYCRAGSGKHRPVTASDYDVVYGLVSLWPQKFVIKDCDQISFHTLRALQGLSAPVIAHQMAPGSYFP